MISQSYQWGQAGRPYRKAPECSNGHRQRQRDIAHNASAISAITTALYRQQRQRYRVYNASVIVAYNGSVISDITQVWHGQQRYRDITDHAGVICGMAHITIWAYDGMAIWAYADMGICPYSGSVMMRRCDEMV
jgi:hypothetical protein